MKISSNFDSGNIEVNSIDGYSAQLSIRKDSNSDFLQWFHFRVQDGKGQLCTLVIANAKETSYVDGWKDYKAVASYDRKRWFRVPTTFDGEKLTISHTPEYDSVYYAYFAPYSYEKHLDLISTAQLSERCTLSTIGKTVDGRDIDKLTVGVAGENKKNVWIIARQHPGESMAEWFMEGMIHRMINKSDALSTYLLDRAIFHIIPNMNVDGSIRGNLRSNAAGKNLNREWQNPTKEKSPEVYYTLQEMEKTGVDMFLDVHGDEGLPYNFIAACEGIPSYNEHIKQQEELFKKSFEQCNPDFQNVYGYPKDEPKQADLTIGSCAVGERFGCLSLTIEMPFKDNANLPNEQYGWSPIRSMSLGESVLYPIKQVLGSM